MTRQSRLVLILGIMAVAGVSGLAFVAEQYKKALVAPAHDDAADARRRMEGFVAGRQAVRSVDARYGGDVRGRADAMRAFRSERYAAFNAHGMTLEDYDRVRDAWRAVHDGSADVDPGLAAAFRARPEAIADAALRPDLDDLDVEIK